MFITADDGLVKLIFSFQILEVRGVGILKGFRLSLPKICKFSKFKKFNSLTSAPHHIETSHTETSQLICNTIN